MKTAIIIIIVLIVYAIIGYVFATCIAAWDDSGDIMDYFALGVLWILILPFLLLYLIAKFIGKRIAVIPVVIISLIKLKKEREI